MRVKTSFEVSHKRGDGYLIYAEKTREFDFLKRYDTWRSDYCHRYRNGKLWLRFRKGNVSPLVLVYALILKLFRR